MHQRDRRTDRQTDTGQQQRPRLRIASRGKNVLRFFLKTRFCKSNVKLLQSCRNEPTFSLFFYSLSQLRDIVDFYKNYFVITEMRFNAFTFFNVRTHAVIHTYRFKYVSQRIKRF